MSRKFVLSRRLMLRGMIGGSIAAIGLPALEAMLDSNGEALGASPAPRYLVWFWGNGMIEDEWDPQMEGENWSSALTAPLDLDPEVKKYISILTGFNSRAPEKITHHEGMSIFNGYPFQGGGDLTSYAGGITLDQLIANKLEGQTLIKSIQLGVSSQTSYMDHGTTMFALSHTGAGAGAALPPSFNPQNVWTSIFGSFVPKNDPSGKLRGDVLSAVKDQTAKLKNRLGKTDIQRLDQHLDGIDQLQKKISAIPPTTCTPPGKPAEDNQSNPEHLDETTDAMHDLIVYAFSCNLTPVATLMMHGGAAATTFTNIGQSKEHHMSNTHHQNNTNWHQDYHDVVIWHMQKFQALLAKMHATPDGVGTLLDNSIVFASSDCSDGFSHSVDNQPMLIAGKGGGYLKNPGIHYHSPSGENPTDVLLALMQAYDPATTSVGGGATASNTPCTKIKA